MDFHIHVHHDDETKQLLKLILEEVKAMQADLTRLRADIARNTDLLKSAETTLAGIAKQLRDALAGPNPQAEINALADSLENDDAGLAAAIAENTQAAPTAQTQA